MASPIESVNPGDLITSKMYNHIAEHVNELLQRVTVLESLVQPGDRVTLLPYIGAVHLGEEITIQGTNFEVPARFNQVTLDGGLITQFNPGTDDSHLVFNVPTNLIGVPKDATFSITNRHGSASITLTVLPATAVIPTGELRVNPGPTNVGVIQVGQTFTFPYILDSQTDIPETYLLAVLYSSAVGADAAAWSANTQVRNLTGQPVTSLMVSPGAPVTVNVQVTVPAGAVSVDMAMQVFSVHSPADPLLNPTSSTQALVIGQAVQVNDPRTTLGQLFVSPANRLINHPLLGQAIAAPPGAQTLLRVTAEFTVAGTYTYSAQVRPPGAPAVWTVQVVSPNPPSTTETAGSQQDIVVQLTAPANADPLPSRTLEIHAARTGAGPNFDSWFSIPITIG